MARQPVKTAKPAPRGRPQPRGKAQPKKAPSKAAQKAMVAANKARTKQQKKSGGGKFSMIFAVVFVLGMMFALPTMLVLTIGLLPTLVALVTDIHPRRYAAKSVGALNLAGTIPFLMTLWTGQDDLITAMKILTDTFAWLVIYSAAGAGWLLYLGMPSVAGIFMEITAHSRIHKIEARQKELIEEWGPEVDRTKQGTTDTDEL